MYNLITCSIALIQTVIMLIALPFVIYRIIKLRRIGRQIDILYIRCAEIVEDLRNFDSKSNYVAELFFDFNALSAWDPNPEILLTLHQAFIDKWEAKIADGEILRTWENKNEK